MLYILSDRVLISRQDLVDLIDGTGLSVFSHAQLVIFIRVFVLHRVIGGHAGATLPSSVAGRLAALLTILFDKSVQLDSELGYESLQQLTITVKAFQGYLSTSFHIVDSDL